MNRTEILVLAMLLATACGENQPSPAPTTPSQAAPSALSGVVYEVTAAGRQPLAGVGIDVSPEDHSFLPAATTDADGHYKVSSSEFHNAPGAGAGNLKVIATKAGYSQPCRAPISNSAGGVLDLYVVSDQTLATTGLPPSMPIAQPTLSGVVFEQTPEGPRAFPGAWVTADFSSGLGWAPSATTRSDAGGRYLLCAVDDAAFTFSPVFMFVSEPGYSAVYVPVNTRVVRTFDIELKRQ